MAWDKNQARLFAAQAKREWGPGWDYISRHQRQDVMATKLLSVIFAQDAKTVNVKDVNELWLGMLKYAGLFDDEGPGDPAAPF